MEEIQLEDFKLSILALWQKKLLIVAATIFATLVGLILTFDTQIINTYYASTTVYSVGVTSAQGNTSEKSITSYTEIISSNKVCERAASLVGTSAGVDADTIKNMIGVQAVSDSVLSITAYSKDQDLAVSVSNAVAEAFVREATSMAGNDSIRILDAATNAAMQNDGRKNINIKRLMFAMMGFVASTVLIMCKELLSSEVRTIEQCIDEDEDEIIGIIPKMN